MQNTTMKFWFNTCKIKMSYNSIFQNQSMFSIYLILSAMVRLINMVIRPIRNKRWIAICTISTIKLVEKVVFLGFQCNILRLASIWWTYSKYLFIQELFYSPEFIFFVVKVIRLFKWTEPINNPLINWSF